MTKFHRKNSVTEAYFWNGESLGEDAPDWVVWSITCGPQPEWITCKTASGDIHVNEPCWLIRELDGKGCYPCKIDIFKATYEEIENEGS
jgi:hypothetical protein